ncbi:heterokaryon incompatibility protein-domain-containing protein [Phaeosphaeriaceae sp. PMI808]|nr:heterokaryon incompatibility protein-domain-containing protein [Phaeosphaeriaceae sp. PMI808]
MTVPSRYGEHYIYTLPPSLPSGSGVLGPKTYKYLALGEMEFRLVKILPETMSKLKCEILHRSLNDAPDYIAISYAWGDGLDTKPLRLAGAVIPVAASLYDTLEAVRQKKLETLVWVDALCIDQQNKDERATQVRLMGHIYSRAMSAAIWLGPAADKSPLAMQLLHEVANHRVPPERIRSAHKHADSAALLTLFKRDYWKRLWVVQEVLLARERMVYCGDHALPWEVYQTAANAFWDRYSDPYIRLGPSSFPDPGELMQLGSKSLLQLMRVCRKKLSENPRDKVFGILGMLPEVTQQDFPTVYTDVVDYIISTTDRLDVIREAIHFPLNVNSTGLPSWCPDWSHIPDVSGLRRNHGFDASWGQYGPTQAQYRFYDHRRKLEISAIKLDTIRAIGIAVGTFCGAQDYLTTFLNWRATLLQHVIFDEGNTDHPLHMTFCRTLCFGQIPNPNSQQRLWHRICYHVFSSLIAERLPRLPMDAALRYYATITNLLVPNERRNFLQVNFGNQMMGRNFCITEQGLMGMGSGYMRVGDLVVVPFGCSTPILLRPDGPRDEHRYVGDIYIDGYMNGEAIKQLTEIGRGGSPSKGVTKYKLR